MGLNNWFAHTVVYHPYLVLAVVAILSGTCLVVPFTLKPFPNFSDPQMVSVVKIRFTVISNIYIYIYI